MRKTVCKHKAHVRYSRIPGIFEKAENRENEKIISSGIGALKYERMKGENN